MDQLHVDLCVATNVYNAGQARQAAHESVMLNLYQDSEARRAQHEAKMVSLQQARHQSQSQHEAAMLSLQEEQVELKKVKNWLCWLNKMLHQSQQSPQALPAQLPLLQVQQGSFIRENKLGTVQLEICGTFSLAYFFFLSCQVLNLLKKIFGKCSLKINIFFLGGGGGGGSCFLCMGLKIVGTYRQNNPL
ncbi:hypothetical protein XENTR_v10015222 [Xenopus tropicalis]|nr:hypothetical protein XENTR_v10015222 [Xenopus tropicalis]